MHNLSLLSILNSLARKAASQKEINLLAKRCIRISRSYLFTFAQSRYHGICKDSDFIDQVSIDSIVPLFVKSMNGNLGINNSIENWDGDIKTEEDADHFLTNVVWNRTEQTIAKTLKLHDPFFGKIHNTLSVCIRKHSFNKIRYLGTYYIIPDEGTNITGSFLTRQEFESIPATYFVKKQKELFDSLFSYIENNFDCDLALPFNLLILRIKSILVGDPITDSEPAEEFYLSQKMDIKAIVDRSLNEIYRHLDEKYISNHKLSVQEGDIFKNVFRNLALDVQNGGIQGGLYSYFQSEMPELTREEFYDAYHTILNYLFNNFKNSIGGAIEY
ncbi:MAG: hypothetical protein K8F36_02385 [Melioribacteraceae bacterium]|nr:hypothetical protein [Melioribacteraceae bacterium]